MPKIPIMRFVSLDWENVSSAPARIVRAPTPISARAVHPHGIGRFVPDAVFTYIPPISQTGANVHGPTIRRNPRTIRIIPGIESFMKLFFGKRCVYTFGNCLFFEISWYFWKGE
jgi:hypothetical protein